MRPSLLAFFLAVIGMSGRSQCLTDFTKLTPEPSLDYTQNFGRAVAMYDDYLAVGLPEHDSLGRIAGLVYIYQLINDHWQKVATMRPSDPKDALQFGSALTMSQNYLLVGAAGFGGKVYLYKKPSGGWQSQSELTSFSAPHTNLFGCYQNSPIAISQDEQTIAVSDAYYYYNQPNGRSGSVFVYHKTPTDEWNGAITPFQILSPETDAQELGRAGVVITGDRIITGTFFAPTANGRLYVFRDPSGEFLDVQLEAKLSAYESDKTAWLGHEKIVTTSEGIFAPIVVDLNTPDAKQVVAFYEFPSTGVWTDMDYTCAFPLHDNNAVTSSFPRLATNGTDIIATSGEVNGSVLGNAYTTIIRKGTSGWCDPEYELLDTYSPFPGQFSNTYASILAANQNNHVTVGVVPHPENPQANLAVKVFSKASDNSWQSQLLYPTRKGTAGHRFGNAILGFEDYMFVGAPSDGTVKLNAGAVYVYKKNSNQDWEQTGKILAPIEGRYDDVFGSALASNGTDLAIGASGFEPHGRVFIYRKNSFDWSHVQMVQEIELPEDILTVFAYGSNLAMDEHWLLIPYVQNSPARQMLAIYQKNGSTWEFFQAVEVGFANIFAKNSTLAVDIEDEVIIAGGTVLERNVTTGQWAAVASLMPSDPEPMQIAPDFSHWITNGSMFGHSVDIAGNNIFIGAPTKDFGSTWDVGAVYVYTKLPGQSWVTRKENAKILPRVKDEGELFGYSMKSIGNILITGAPGADFRKDGVTARNKPGRAYVFQAKDYYWNDVVPLIDFTGDSFVKDYFGIAVNLDETDFIVAATIEDLESGKLSGSVYVTPTPPIVMLVPPVCSNRETITLFGYPFGGTWSGPGLIDAAQGIFDPKVAGIGEHEFTYSTVSCAYAGKLKITVEEPVEPKLAVNPEHYICNNTMPNVTIGVESNDQWQYLWYFRQSDNDAFFPLNITSPTITATSKGEYKARVFNGVCESFSPVITLKIEQVDVVIQDLPRICMDDPAGIPLSAEPPGGVWFGDGVAGGKLFTSTLSSGSRQIRYRYTSPNNCQYEASTVYNIDRLAAPSIRRTSGDLCVEGEVQIAMTSAMQSNVTYTWERKLLGTQNFLAVNQNVTVLGARARGDYRVRAVDGQCTVNSNTVSIVEDAFPVTMLPEESELTHCYGDAQLLSISPVNGKHYQWYYAINANDPGEPINGAVANTITTDSTGFYYCVVTGGICEIKSPWKHVLILPAEDIFVPNVFTPNNDGYNDVFMITTNLDDIDLHVFNRYGKEVFRGDQNSKWLAEGLSTGVYFWIVTYVDCRRQSQQLKGFVHLIR